MEVIIYTKAGCPMCMALKKMLDNKHIEYTTNSNIDEMISMGFSSLPMLSVDGVLMTFKEAANWVKEK